VVFLYFRKGGQLRPAGTAFFGGYPIPEHPTRAITTLLTAQHVIAHIRIHSDDGVVLLRVNTTAGGVEWYETSEGDWFHDGSSTDCAVLLFRPSLESSDWAGWSLGSVATDEVIERERIGVGDEVFVVGLFRHHIGRDRNEPIVRVGNIAAIPTDPIRLTHFGNMRAILIEARSIGGLSGSPVFIHMGFARWREGQVMTAGTDSPFFLLGLMHGHWEALEADVDSIDASDESESYERGERLNTGIGVVVPANEIMAMLESHTLLRELAAARRDQLDCGIESLDDLDAEDQS
jgi:hypothetical protein